MTEHDKGRFRDLVFQRIAKGHFVTLRKAVPEKKSPTGKAIPAERIQVAGCSTKRLLDKSAQLLLGAAQFELEAELGALRKTGVIHCTNGVWWRR